MYDLKTAKARHIARKFDERRKLKHPLPYSSATTSLPILFQDHFTNNLINIINVLPTPTLIPSAIPPPYSFCEFSEPSSSQIAKLLNNTKSSFLTDPLPLKLLHQVDTITPSLHKIYSSSLSTGIVPDDFKTAVITHILKERSLDSLVIVNYRPISNLSIHSKTLEPIISAQLSEYLDSNNILNSFQSAYVPHKSTETALTRITYYILSTLINNKGSLLVILDMSAAFETLDHSIMVQRLSSIGIKDTALKWFKSYLSNRYSTDNK